MRNLIHIPILHTQADMGALSQTIKEMTIAKLGQAGWERNVSVIDGSWSRIREEISSWPLAYKQLRLYQDGLPVCGREADIVKELARGGSPNHELLLDLMERGATLMGTESPVLLVREYNLVKEALKAGHSRKAALLTNRYKTQSRALLAQRDRFIAERINSTLHRDETGILFLGMLHSISERLAKDIHLTRFSSAPASPEAREK